MGSLALLDYLEGQPDAALAGLAKVKALQEKPADKLLSGMQLGAIIAAQKHTHSHDGAAYFNDVGQRIGSALEAMPFDVVGSEVREMKASAEIMSEALALGYLREVLQPTVDKAGGVLSSEFAPALIGARY